MKYEIDTIPVWDALKEESECLFCLLEKRSRLRGLNYFLGDSVMVPETRVKVNETGFSPKNWRILSKDPNRLGLGLITSTHLQTLREKWIQKSKALLKTSQGLLSKGGIAALTASKSPLKKQLDELISWWQQEESRCLMEERVQTDLNRYYFTAARLFVEDREFKSTFEASKGICLHHLGPFLQFALNHVGAKEGGELTKACLERLEKSFGRLEGELLHFISMYDATNPNRDWGQSRDSIERTLQRLLGQFPEWEETKRTRK